MWTVDVWHSLTFPVGPEPDGWRRYRVQADSPVEAEMLACQMTASAGGRTPVRSVIVDWPEEPSGRRVPLHQRIAWRWWAWRQK